MSTRIEIENIVKEFPAIGAAGKTRAVDDITLTIEPGELFFLLGPSGCGKTTLLRMLAGFIAPTAGSIRYNGRDVTHTAPNKRNTGMVFQSYALWPHMTVEANVAFGLGVRKVPKAQRLEQAREALAAVQMDQYAKRKPNQLSGGQQQRVALARALVIRPDVLLLDEPLSNLDAKLRIELRTEIRRICKDSGITTVYVTHDQKEALSMADRVAILKLGKTIQVGSPRDCYRRPKSKFVAEFLGETNFIPATVASSSDAGLELDTAAGRVHASPDAAVDPLAAGAKAMISLRPEALRLVPADTPGALVGEHRSTIHLGEIAQHHVMLGGQIEVKAAEINPLGAAHESAFLDHTGEQREGTSKVGLAVDPRDAVVLGV